MAEVVTPTTEPTYIINLALTAAPFNQSLDPKLFFDNGQAGHRLNLLRHLIYSGDKIANLCADEGLGKTTLLNQLAVKMGSEVKICLVDANDYPDITAILAKLLIDLGVDSSEILTASQPEMILQRRLRQLEKAGINYILLIDNGDALDSNALATMSLWLTWQENGNYLLGAVLASKQAIMLQGEAINRLQKVDLPALSESEVPDYLRHRLSVVGFEQALPFSDQDIKRLYQLSTGNPRQLNQLAHQQLLGLNTQSKIPLIDDMMSLLSRWSGIVLVVSAVIILVMFREPLSHIFETRDNTIKEQEIELVQPLEHIETVKVDDSEPSADVGGREELESLLAELPDEVANTENLIEIEELTEPAQPVNEHASTVPSIFGVDWISEQLPTHYTFQLMGSWEREEIDAFIKQHGLEGDVAVFESLRNGRVWYALIYGSFADKSTALKASKRWPAPLNSLPSWLRRFDSVQQQIKNNAVIG